MPQAYCANGLSRPPMIPRHRPYVFNSPTAVKRPPIKAGSNQVAWKLEAKFICGGSDMPKLASAGLGRSHERERVAARPLAYARGYVGDEKDGGRLAPM